VKQENLLSAGAGASPSQINVVDKLTRLKELTDNGLICEEESLEKKKDLLDKM